MQSQKLALLSLRGRVTLFYLRQINELYKRKFGGNGICPLVLRKTNFDSLERSPTSGSYQLANTMKFDAESLKGVEKLIIPSITLHEALDRMTEKETYSNSVVHPIETTIAKLTEANCQRVMLFSSRNGVNSRYLKSFFNQVGIELVLPNDEQQVVIDKYRQNIDSFCESNDDSKQYFDLLSSNSQDQVVVIACTQLSLNMPLVSANVYDMARIQIAEALTVYG